MKVKDFISWLAYQPSDAEVLFCFRIGDYDIEEITKDLDMGDVVFFPVMMGGMEEGHVILEPEPDEEELDDEETEEKHTVERNRTVNTQLG